MSDTNTSSANTNIPEIVTKLKAALTALGDVGDLRSDNEKSAYRERYIAIQSKISFLADAPQELEKYAALLTDLQMRRANVVAIEAALVAEIKAFADPMTITDPRERDRELHRQSVTHRQLAMLGDGHLMRRGSKVERLDVLDERIRELTQQRDRVIATTNAHVRAASELFAAAV
jgi:hypothetical protein